MRLLAIEAGGDVLSAALFEQGQALASAFVHAPRRQTESLAPLVQELLARQGWEARSLQQVACAAGPGSFSGLRSSLAFGTGLALALPALKLTAVSTLQAWAEAMAPDSASKAWVLLDGRRGQAYGTCLQRQAGGWRELETPALKELGYWRQALGTDLCIGDLEHPLEPSAALALAVGRLAQAPDLALPWEPIYLRRSEAEILWEKLHPQP